MKGDSVEIDSKKIYTSEKKNLRHTMHSMYSCISLTNFLGDLLVQKNATYTRINTIVVIKKWRSFVQKIFLTPNED